MATPRGQRIAIWVIAVAMVVGTLGSFLILILDSDNNQREQARIQQLENEYRQAAEAQSKELSDQYYDTLVRYESRVSSFDANAVEELATTDLETGDGEALTSESTFTAYYIGWNPDGEIFDSSIEGESLRDPFTVSPGMVIQGWTEGVDGMNVGGIRELTIPSDLAYGEQGQGELIPPNTPLKFVVMVIPQPDPVEVPEELLRYYSRQQGF